MPASRTGIFRRPRQILPPGPAPLPGPYMSPWYASRHGHDIQGKAFDRGGQHAPVHVNRGGGANSGRRRGSGRGGGRGDSVLRGRPSDLRRVELGRVSGRGDSGERAHQVEQRGVVGDGPGLTEGEIDFLRGVKGVGKTDGAKGWVLLVDQVGTGGAEALPRQGLAAEDRAAR